MLTLILLVTAPLHHIARLWAFLGTAMTSPEKSARLAWDYGRALNSRFGYLFAFLGAAISVTVTAILWTITLPLVFTEAVALIPALGSVIASIAQLPIVASALAYLNGTAVLISGTLPAAFSAAATAISTAFGVTVSATTLAVAAIVAFIAAPVTSTLSRDADALSNRWTLWSADSPLLLRTQLGEETPVLHQVLSRAKTNREPSSKYILLREQTEGNLVEAEDSASSAKRSSDRLDSAPESNWVAQSLRNPAPGIPCEQPARRYTEV